MAPTSTHEFEQHYAAYLKKTNRQYDDAEVKELPDTFFYNLHRQEWITRQMSTQRLLKYLNRPVKEGETFRLLEVGCGNAWLAGKIADMPQFHVTGLDVYEPLLTQAARVHPKASLELVRGDLFDDLFPVASFDVVLLFDTISYFPNLQQLLNRCRQYLKQGGEIHILESPLLPEKEVEAAQAAYSAQFEEEGTPEISAYYHVHSRKELAPFDYQFLYRPGGLSKLFGKKDSPYPWVKIVN